MTKDRIFASPMTQVEVFKFDQKVAEVFPNMIKRSVPGYNEIVALTGVLADIYATDNSNIYDLGCALGASSLAIRNFVKAKTNLVAVDNSPDMVRGCKDNLSKQQSIINFTMCQEDLTTTKIKNASVVVMNFILQFIKPDKRTEILENVWHGLNENGVLIIAEKTKFKEQYQQKNFTKWHEHFKKANGYSELEIAQKRTALENILVSDTEAGLTTRLNDAGFNQKQKWFQAFNFQAWLATK